MFNSRHAIRSKDQVDRTKPFASKLSQPTRDFVVQRNEIPTGLQSGSVIQREGEEEEDKEHDLYPHDLLHPHSDIKVEYGDPKNDPNLKTGGYAKGKTIKINKNMSTNERVDTIRFEIGNAKRSDLFAPQGKDESFKEYGERYASSEGETLTDYLHYLSGQSEQNRAKLGAKAGRAWEKFGNKIQGQSRSDIAEIARKTMFEDPHKADESEKAKTEQTSAILPSHRMYEADKITDSSLQEIGSKMSNLYKKYFESQNIPTSKHTETFNKKIGKSWMSFKDEWFKGWRKSGDKDKYKNILTYKAALGELHSKGVIDKDTYNKWKPSEETEKWANMRKEAEEK